MLFFGVCFLLYFLKLSAGNGFKWNILRGFSLDRWTDIFTCKNIISFTCDKIRFFSVIENVSHQSLWNKKPSRVRNREGDSRTQTTVLWSAEIFNLEAFTKWVIRRTILFWLLNKFVIGIQSSPLQICKVKVDVAWLGFRRLFWVQVKQR